VSDQLDLPDNMGLVVSSVFPDTPAASAGLKANDIILEIGGKAVTSDANSFQQLVRGFKADEKVNVVLMRKGKKETLKDIKLPEAKPEQANPFQPLIVPQLQIPNLNVPFPPQAFGGQTSAMSITMNNGNFTINCTEDTTKYTVTGVKDEGPAKVTSIEVSDDGKVVKAESLEKLDAKYRPAVEKMLKSIR
jgi:membrane-associated protease RseP (regulator of RpoE activity)